MFSTKIPANGQYPGAELQLIADGILVKEIHPTITFRSASNVCDFIWDFGQLLTIYEQGFWGEGTFITGFGGELLIEINKADGELLDPIHADAAVTFLEVKCVGDYNGERREITFIVDQVAIEVFARTLKYFILHQIRQLAPE